MHNCNMSNLKIYLYSYSHEFCLNCNEDSIRMKGYWGERKRGLAGTEPGLLQCNSVLS